MDRIFSFIVLFLITFNITVIWFYGDIKFYILKLFHISEAQDNDSLFLDLRIKYGKFIGKLFSCPLCLSFHIAYLVAFIGYIFNFSGYEQILISPLSFPGLIFLLFSALEK